jgi:hypothetical protein
MFALILLVVLLVIGRCMEELSWSGIALILVIIGCAAALISSFDQEPVFMTAVFALIDVFLVIKIFKGDLIV